MNKQTILVVDDTPMNIALITSLLKDVYKTKIAVNGAKALKIAAADPLPDLILLDIMMPGMDGYEVCQRLKSDARTRHIPVIFLTAMAETEDEQKGLSLGATDYITKPISPPILMARVQTQLQLKQATDRLRQQNDILEQKVQERTRQLSLTNQALARFIPNEFLRALGRANIRDVQLGDHAHRTMTVLFSDIRAYTSLSETMTPREVFDFLNGYLRRIGPVIRAHNGFVSNYIGDGIMVIFPDAPDDAARAAIAIQQTVADYNRERQSKNRRAIRIGTGINTGPLMLGVIGDANQMDTTLVADVVNTASRLEGMTKYYGVDIVIGESTWRGLANPEKYHSRLLDRVQVKGKTRPITMYELFDANPTDLREQKLKTLPVFQQGQQHYFAGAFAEALKCFTDVLTSLPDDLTTKHYLERSSKFLLQGVPADWQGVRIMSAK